MDENRIDQEQDTAEQELKAYAGVPNVETDTEIPVKAYEETFLPPNPELDAVVPAVPEPSTPAGNVVWDSQNRRWCHESELPPAPVAEAPARRTRVAIVGFASHWTRAPFEDSDVEIWSLNEFYDVAPNQLLKPRQEGRLRWFEIHTREAEYEGNPFLHSRNKSNEHAAKMAALGCPVYMQRHWDDIPMSVPYPRDLVIAKYGRYFTNSISWMIALAIEEGFTEIGVYGVDMATNTEYGYERPSCEYILGWVRALGIRLVMPMESDLLKSAFLYGFESDQAGFIRAKLEAREKELVNRKGQVEGVINHHQALFHQLLGAQENTKYIKEVMIGNYDPRRAPQAGAGEQG